jgi:small neutral amino acid transporter SnatA (MarC family)
MDKATSGLILIGIGVLSILGALLNWRIVVGSGKLIPRLLGPTGAKIFMIIVGVALIGLGAAVMAGLM